MIVVIPSGDLLRQIEWIAALRDVAEWVADPAHGEHCTRCGGKVAWNQAETRLHHFDVAAGRTHRPTLEPQEACEP